MGARRKPSRGPEFTPRPAVVTHARRRSPGRLHTPVPSTKYRGASAMAQQPWLVGIVACALAADAVPVQGELRRRRLQLRSVPAGRARAAWTCAAPAGTIALVVSGSGIAAARQAAGFWMPRARRVAVAGTAIATPLAGEAAVILDGDAELAAHASGGPNTAIGRIATVRDVGRSEQALISLGRAG